MESLLTLMVGFLFFCSSYLILQGNLIKLVIGLSLLSNAANLLIFVSGRVTRGTPPLIPRDATEISGPFANPLSEALILTAIVIGFGLLAFSLVLAFRAQSEFNTVRADDIESVADDRSAS